MLELGLQEAKKRTKRQRPAGYPTALLQPALPRSSGDDEAEVSGRGSVPARHSTRTRRRLRIAIAHSRVAWRPQTDNGTWEQRRLEQATEAEDEDDHPHERT